MEKEKPSLLFHPPSSLTHSLSPSLLYCCCCCYCISYRQSLRIMASIPNRKDPRSSIKQKIRPDMMNNTRSCFNLLLLLLLTIVEVKSIITIEEWQEAFDSPQVSENIETYLSERPVAKEGGNVFFSSQHLHTYNNE